MLTGTCKAVALRETYLGKCNYDRALGNSFTLWLAGPNDKRWTGITSSLDCLDKLASCQC